MRYFLLLGLLAACGVTDLVPPVRQTVLRPSGVVTQPNEFGELPPGTLAVGENIRIRKQGVLEPRPAFTESTYEFTGGRVPIKVWPRSDGSFYGITLLSSATRLESSGFVGSSTISFREDGTDFDFSPGKAHISEVRSRRIITSDVAPAVIENSTVARQAGLPSPKVFVSAVTGGTTWLTANYVAYKVVLKRVLDNGYIVRGAVSPPIAARNSSGADRRAQLQVTWPADSFLPSTGAGMYIEFYRVLQRASLDELDDRYRFAFEYALTGTDVTNGYAITTDPCLEGALGADLYTNQNASTNNFMPPPSSDVATFKGATFYAATTAWHTIVTGISAKWGALSTAEERTNGIGSRQTTGNTSSGTNTILSVADTTGVKIGQYVGATPFALGTQVTNVSGSTVTVSNNASSTLVGTSVNFYDVIEIDGDIVNMRTPGAFLSDTALMADHPVVAFLDRILDTADNTEDGIQFTFTAPVSGSAAFTLRATNGANYSPPLPEYTQTPQSSTNDPRTNRLFFSKIDQPEAVPVDQQLRVGQGTILRLFPTQDALFVFCTDGIFRIVGDGDDWSVEPFNKDVRLLAPDAISSMEDKIFMLTNEGLIAFSDSSGFERISTPLIGDTIKSLWKQFMETTPALPYTWGVQLACDEFNHEVWLSFNDYTDTGHVQTWIWNTETNTFVTQAEMHPTAIAYSAFDLSIALVDSNAISIYGDTDFMPATVVFNPVFGDDLGNLKQWIDVTAFFESVSDPVTFIPAFNEEAYLASYTLAAGTQDHVMSPVLNACHGKSLKFGFLIQPVEWELKGVSYRFRGASDTLRE